MARVPYRVMPCRVKLRHAAPYHAVFYHVTPSHVVPSRELRQNRRKEKPQILEKTNKAIHPKTAVSLAVLLVLARHLCNLRFWLAAPYDLWYHHVREFSPISEGSFEALTPSQVMVIVPYRAVPPYYQTN